MKPVAVDYELLSEEGILVLRWSDGRITRHDMSELRRLCPCAHCRRERERMERRDLSQLRVIQGPAGEPPARPPRIARVEPVGRYALRFNWNDGHSAGIYTYEFLRSRAG